MADRKQKRQNIKALAEVIDALTWSEMMRFSSELFSALKTLQDGNEDQFDVVGVAQTLSAMAGEILREDAADQMPEVGG